MALNKLYKIVSDYVPYVLTVSQDDIEKEKLKDFNVIFIGTLENNYIADFYKEGLFEKNEKAEGFSIKVMKSPFNEESKIAILCGNDAQGVLYSVRDFEHCYVSPQRYNHFNTVYNEAFKVFQSEMPDFALQSAPAFAYRGIWTWGHVIYDYKSFIDNMSKWKMNFLTLWNDFVPINAKEVVDYAHSRGLKIVWGYSWCWGEEVDPTAASDLEKWSKRIIETYEQQYLALGIDGMYFQTFTEHSPDNISNQSTAKLAANWVNRISARILEKYPDLWIQFGLHATSVKTDLEAIATVDKRLNITWEDAGSFPYHHDPKNVSATEEAVHFTHKASRLRGDEEEFGLVLKGLTMLNWPGFEHQKGPFVLGERSEAFLKKTAVEKEFIWRYAQTYWNKNLEPVLELLRSIKTEGQRPSIVSALIEDGLWEEREWAAGVLFAEAAWNPYRTKEEIVEMISLVQSTHFC